VFPPIAFSLAPVVQAVTDQGTATVRVLSVGMTNLAERLDRVEAAVDTNTRTTRFGLEV